MCHLYAMLTSCAISIPFSLDVAGSVTEIPNSELQIPILGPWKAGRRPCKNLASEIPNSELQIPILGPWRAGGRPCKNVELLRFRIPSYRSRSWGRGGWVVVRM